MANETHQNKIFDVMFADASAGRPESAELRGLLESVTSLSILEGPARHVRAAHKPVVVLAAPKLGASERDTLVARWNSPAHGPIVLAALDPEADAIMRWIECGVQDYFTAPWVLADILPRIRKAALLQPLAVEEPSPVSEKRALDHMIGQSRELRSVMERIPAIAGCDASVLVTGETGTGKELCARAIHYMSRRFLKPFVPLNCGAIPSELVENELFGHASGAYTSAVRQQIGLIQEAEGGTLFLDEVDSLPLAAQVKLLRFLQNKEFRPLGSTSTATANVRLIAATNADPAATVRNGTLRQDLYYRLNVIPLQLPPLRERRDDIPLLAAHFLQRYAREYGKSVPALSEDAMYRLMTHDWPGNVRELENVVARMVVLTDSAWISAEQVGLPAASNDAEPTSLRAAKGQFERSYIEQQLRSFGGNISRAARAAGKNRRSFWELIRKYRIEVEQFRSPAPAKARSASAGGAH